ncbi:hypothetical protein UCRPC4_g01590 [Phaeomoniella chlamydospora]|uniref:SMODS and SLOG-associating 2TM effector domain-containing protein n=1 Tax=Phaeomoniella chlamydospora TaxID=158046 RepID=A0A0G2EUL1_PHACM|nr:hypothetical protein UCRPC4_g01590 [Phaeomoniella chlamydospora]
MSRLSDIRQFIKASRQTYQEWKAMSAQQEQAPADLEKGILHSPHQPRPPPTAKTTTENTGTSNEPTSHISSAIQIPSPKAGSHPPEVPNETLQTFRNLVGIQSPLSLVSVSILRRPAPNIGLYGRVVHAEQDAKKLYKAWSVTINLCLGLQIIVAASLTALGAAGSHSGAVTGFGAVNTVIAGFLTYLKGSGLPSRLKYYYNEWRKLREYIEQREREFGIRGCTLSLEEELLIIERLFEDVTADVEANTPDKYVSMEGIGRKGGDPRPRIARSGIAFERGAGGGSTGPTAMTTTTTTGSASEGGRQGEKDMVGAAGAKVGEGK